MQGRVNETTFVEATHYYFSCHGDIRYTMGVFFFNNNLIRENIRCKIFSTVISDQATKQRDGKNKKRLLK